MDDLIKWLREQVDEDERTAKACAEADGLGHLRSWVELYGPEIAAADAYLARHDPARVLREVEAKRRIIDVVGRWRHYASPDGYYSCSQATEENGFEIDEACCDDDRVGQPCDCGLERRQMAILGPLALPYADPAGGYREEWRP